MAVWNLNLALWAFLLYNGYFEYKLAIIVIRAFDSRHIMVFEKRQNTFQSFLGITVVRLLR
jgi:hypothetical protein